MEIAGESAIKMQENQRRMLFKQWLTEHKGLLFKVARSFSREPSDHDDLLQEISIQLWNAMPGFRGEAKVSTWIYKVALFAAITWSRKETKHTSTTQSLDDADVFLTSSEASKNDSLNWLYAQIRQLNEIDRSLTLLMLDGYSYEEMSQILGISQSNVGVKISRVKLKLASLSEEK